MYKPNKEYKMFMHPSQTVQRVYLFIYLPARGNVLASKTVHCLLIDIFEVRAARLDLRDKILRTSLF